LVNISWLIALSIVICTSCGDGQMSRRKTSLPSGSWPSGWDSKSKSIVPARPYAMTSGGEAR
jgi:hypothetical protein